MAINIANFLRKKQNDILETWIKRQLEDSGLRDSLISNNEIRGEAEEVVSAIVNSVTDKNLDNVNSTDFDNILEILSGISISKARQGFSPKETGVYVMSLKESILQVLHTEMGGTTTELYDISQKMGRLMDNFAISTFETFIKGREEVILRQTDEMTEISTPVIRVWDGILALPIIGTLDSSRTQVIMENLLTEIVETGSTIAILDISGVPTVDSLVAQHLLKAVSATRLMGADCIISGIRPEIAQTIVHLGIDLSQIITKATLASALKYAFRSMRLEVKPIMNKS
ncbi:MAG: STAS domain-containing protein [Bacteroidota bacterium]